MAIQNVPSERTCFSKRKIRQIGLLLLLAFPLLSQVASADQVSLAWDPNPSPDVAGYKVYYGTASRTYGASLDVGNVTTYTLTGLTPGQTYFIAVTDYNQSRSESDFSNEVSTSGGNEGDLIGYWKMDEGSGATASDSSGMGNNGAVTWGAAWTAGKVGGGLSFDGYSGAMTVPNVGGLAPGNTPHTIAAWVNVTSLPMPGNRAWILLLGSEGTGAHHWLLNSSGATQLGAWNGAGVFPTLPVGQWKHLALTFDGTTLAGYVDGVLVGSGAATFNLQGMPLTLAHPHLWENDFNGLVDDVRIYSRALDATEIATLALTSPDNVGTLLP